MQLERFQILIKKKENSHSYFDMTKSDMKKICFAFNHFQYADGVARTAISIANLLVDEASDIEITIRPIFIMKYEVKNLLDPRVKIVPLFGFYFKGLSTLVKALPGRVLHDLIYGKDIYDIEIAFQRGVATKAVASSDNKSVGMAWMHGYDDSAESIKYYKKIKKLVCVSRYNADLIKKKCGEDINVDFCYNPIDEYQVLVKAKENIKIQRCENIQFVTVGRLSKEKGYLRLIKVLNRLMKEKYNFNLWIIGDGPERNRLEEYIIKNNLTDNILLLGQQENPHKFTSKADVFICSSYSEGYSTACTESILLGIPVITTDVSGADEIINEAESGIKVGQKDEELYAGIKYVLDNPQIISSWKCKTLETRERFFAKERLKKIRNILDV